jgi:hypothetical protein
VTLTAGADDTATKQLPTTDAGRFAARVPQQGRSSWCSTRTSGVCESEAVAPNARDEQDLLAPG